MSDRTQTTEDRARPGDRVNTYECRECGEAHDCTSRLRHCPDCGGEVRRVDDQVGAWTSSIAHRTVEQISDRDQA